MHAMGIRQLQGECLHERLTDDGEGCIECGRDFKMNIRYLGTRMNKRQVRGGVTGSRYSYSSGQPVFTIADADEVQFHGEMEDGKPKFALEDAAFADAVEITDVEMMGPEAVASLPLSGLKTHLANHPEMTITDLEDIMAAETLGQNRVGGRKAIQAAINELG